jgi:predicted dehydrogenase
MKGLNIAVLGCGHWGPNYIRVFSGLENVSVKYACDLSQPKLDRIKAQFQNVSTTSDFNLVLKDPSVDAIVIATPSSTHFTVAKSCLEAGKHLLVEKPMTLTTGDAQALVKLSEEKKRIVFVGHTFLYNPGIRKMKEIIDSGELGGIYYLTATRTHLGLVRDDVNVAWDLAPHDIAIFNYLLGQTPTRVDAFGVCHLKKDREDAVFIHLLYPNSVLGQIHVSWVDSNKERTVKVIGSEARIVFDDINNLERVKIYKKGIRRSPDWGISNRATDNTFGEFQLLLRDGDIISPRIEPLEPLKAMCLEFVDCLRTGKKPLTDAQSGYEVVRVMEEIDRALAAHSGH